MPAERTPRDRAASRKSEAPGKREAAREREETARLLRYLAGGAASRVAGDGPGDTLARAGEASRRFDATLLAEAVAVGLVCRRGEVCMLDDAGRAWLRRALCEVEDMAFAAQHGDHRRESVEIEGRRETVTMDAAESPLAALARLKRKDGAPFLDERAFTAGERLRADFTRGQLQPRVSANWEASVAASGSRGGSGIGDLTDSALGARMRVERALSAVGPELSGVLVDVCCFLKGLEAVERERQWPVRSGKLMLRTALSVLARHYDPPSASRGPDRRKSHRWGAEGYSPAFRLP